MSIRFPIPFVPSAATVFVAAVFVTACSPDGDGAAVGIATLEDVAGAEVEDGEVAVALTPDEAALAFSECMRAEGVDIADIGVDADGNLNLRETFRDLVVDFGDEELAAARELCFPLLEGVAFGGGRPRAGLADNPEVQDALLEFTDCIRDEGFDVGDITFGFGGPGGPGQGGTPPGDGTPPERGRGQGRGGFGDPNGRLARLLGLDPEDPAVVDALEVCGPIVDAAFSAAGFGPPDN